MGRFAQGTTVSEERSIAELGEVLRRYGIARHAVGRDRGAALVGFRARGRDFRVVVPLPEPDDPRWIHQLGRRVRLTAEAAAARCLEERRRRMRALALVVKAKLEADASGISTIEAEFLAAVVLPDGRTVGDVVLGGRAAALPVLQEACPP